eukprot:RCo017798
MRSCFPPPPPSLFPLLLERGFKGLTVAHQFEPRSCSARHGGLFEGYATTVSSRLYPAPLGLLLSPTLSLPSCLRGAAFLFFSVPSRGGGVVAPLFHRVLCSHLCCSNVLGARRTVFVAGSVFDSAPAKFSFFFHAGLIVASCFALSPLSCTA